MLYEEKVIETIPVGPLGLIPLKSCTELGNKVDRYLVDWRRERESEHKSTIAFTGYQRDSYIINASTPRFGSGEGKGIIEESVRGDDLYIMVDVCNYSLTYSLFGMTNHMSPDDHFQDLKRIIAAAAGKATFDPKNREDCIRYFEDCFSKLNADEVLPKLEAIDIVVSELAHFKDNHTSEQALVNGFMSPITYPNGDQITLAMPPIKMGCVEQPHAEKAHKIGEDNEKLFKEFDL